MRRLFFRSPVTRLTLEPPAPQAGRAGLALVLIVRDEARHIGEWAAFHKLAGAAHVIAYDNGCSDGTVAELRRVLGGALTVVPWAQKLREAATGQEIHNQILAYAHAVANFGARFRWMACVDADEFLVPVTGPDLPAALAGLEHCPQISLPWHNFGRNGHDGPPAGGVLENYTRRAADPISGARGVTNFKVVFDPVRVTAVKVHDFQTDGNSDTWNDRGERFSLRARATRGFYSVERIQLNHYYTRSGRELAAKIARGSNRSVEAARHAARVWRNVANIEAAEVEDTLAVDYLARVGAPVPLL
ncbi:glycosyl transferase family 92 [Rhodovulum imhoffii]|uniref:Glycosyl transferase family 92 n=1 Tax=Rhodovulum imhoffii TaxID=365340 RepID=A0A2T5BVD1_9RHOB|nr:glycosyltransferase family 92 protein [Rhodovulum imhoffii]MBK5934217.1 hypothetical protein [Rhodovulum imhoffii]PTN03536.1 glycosyl transferase family 92 [Rhodovulum imhoffii]